MQWCEGIADTFVQLLPLCIAVLIANVDRRTEFNSGCSRPWRPPVTAGS